MRKRIHINRLGYMTGAPKTAVCCVTAGIFYLVDAVRGINVYAGRLSRPFYDRESGDTVRLADFSDYNIAGTYFIRAGYRRSDSFKISEAPYKEIRSLVLKGMYLNRCGFDFTKDRTDLRSDRRYLRRECHMEAVYKSAGMEETFNASGGWHCSGDYSKNVRSAGLAAADILYALRLFEESFDEENRDLYEDECRWGLDWLLKMQDSDGGVYDGITSERSNRVIHPNEDDKPYFLGEKTCCSALKFTAVAAAAAVYFKRSDPKYSELLRRAAERCWIWIVQSDEYSYYNSKNGIAAEVGEGLNLLESDFMWALCEMYDLTGDPFFSKMIESRYITSGFSGFGKGSCGGFAALSVLLSERNCNRSVEALVRKHMTDKAERLWIADRASGYCIARSADDGFGFESNFGILSDCMDFITAYLVSGDNKYLMGATEHFSYICGVNPLSMSFVTGCGESCCKSPCHMLSALFDSEPPIPGMVVCGANARRSDDYSKWQIEQGIPEAKCYVDSEFSISTNKPSIHISAPLIFISAFYDKVGRSALSGVHKSKDLSEHNNIIDNEQ